MASDIHMVSQDLTSVSEPIETILPEHIIYVACLTFPRLRLVQVSAFHDCPGRGCQRLVVIGACDIIQLRTKFANAEPQSLKIMGSQYMMLSKPRLDWATAFDET